MRYDAIQRYRYTDKDIDTHTGPYIVVAFAPQILLLLRPRNLSTGLLANLLGNLRICSAIENYSLHTSAVHEEKIPVQILFLLSSFPYDEKTKLETLLFERSFPNSSGRV